MSEQVEKLKLIKGDCLQILSEIPDKSIDMVCADLPYGTTQCKWDTVIDLQQLWQHYKRIMKDRGVIVLHAQTPFDKVLGASNLQMLRYEWIWEKTAATGHLNAKKMPMKAHENILVYYSELPKYRPQKTTGHSRKVNTAEHKRNSLKTECYGEHGLTGYDSTERYPRSVLQFPTDKQTCSLHPTQKPLALIEYLVRTYTDEGDTVLDNCMGSGTTGVACKNLKRNFIGIELEDSYFSIATDRIAAA